MAQAARTQGDHLVEGNLTVTGGITASGGYTTAIQRSEIAQDALALFSIPPTWWRVWNAIDTNLPGTSASDDLGLYGGTFGTNGWTVRTYDVKNAGAVTLYARAAIPLPAEYDAGQTIKLRFSAGMITTVASASATLDVEAYVLDEDDTVGSDICTTSAADINSLTFADKDFTLTPTGLTAGDIIDVRITVAVNDSATGTAVIAAIGAAKLLADIRG